MTTRERTIVIVAGVAIGAFALDSIAISPLWDKLTDADARRATAQEEILRGEGVQQNRNRAARVWKDLKADTLQDDAPAAEGQLLNGVRVWAQRAGVNLVSLKPDRSDDEQGFGRLVVRAQATGSMQSLSNFLYQIETSSVPVRMVDLTLNSRKDGEDDLALLVGLATIYDLPPEAEQTGGTR